MSEHHTQQSGGEKRGRTMMAASAMTAGAAGSVAYGLTRRTWWGKLLAITPGVMLGISAMARARGTSIGEQLSKTRSSSIEQRVHINRPPQEVYDFVRHVENLPQFMTHTHEVREDKDGRVHWVIKIANGLKMAYDAQIIDDKPGELFTYRSAPEEAFEETGTLRFEPAGAGGTDLIIRMAWEFPMGAAGAAVGKLFEPMTESLLQEELNGLKQALES